MSYHHALPPCPATMSYHHALPDHHVSPYITSDGNGQRLVKALPLKALPLKALPLKALRIKALPPQWSYY